MDGADEEPMALIALAFFGLAVAFTVMTWVAWRSRAWEPSTEFERWGWRSFRINMVIAAVAIPFLWGAAVAALLTAIF